MGEWMDSKNEVKVGDHVMYEDGTVVADEHGNPLKVIDIKPYLRYNLCVFYCNGEFDDIRTVRKCHSLLLELL